MKTKWIAIIIPALVILIGITALNFTKKTPVVEQDNSITDQKPLVSIPIKDGAKTENINTKESKTARDNSGSNLALTEKQIPETTLQGNLSQHLDQLLSQFNSGDLEAGYILALNLQDCFDADVNADEFNKSINQLYKSHETRTDSADFLAYDAQRIEMMFHYCDDVPTNIRRKYFDYLSLAAAQGYPPAQLLYGIHVPPELIGDSFAKLSEEQQHIKISELKIKAGQHLESAALSGSVRAMVFMVVNHRLTEGKDLVKALAYNLALLDLTLHDGLLKEYSDIRHSLEREMTFAEIEQANSRSIKIIKTVIENGVIYRI